MTRKEREAAQAAQFLGQEFILWLYWRSSRSPLFSLEEHGLGDIELAIEEQITLESLHGEGYRETIQTREPAEQDDVRDSIRTGRLPVATRVKVSRGKADWRFALTAMPLAMRSIKLPSGEKRDADEETVHLRLIQIEELDNIMRTLFQIFLLERTDESFLTGMREFLGLEH